MYESRTVLENTRDLNQGDVLQGVLTPNLLTEKNFALRQGSKLILADEEALRNRPPTLRVMHEVQHSDCLVVSNSCDNVSGLPLLLAPIRPLVFPAGCDSPEKQWRYISEMATGSANTKLFYLPASADFGLIRSEAQLVRMFSVDHSYVSRCVKEAGTSRVCGLKAEAQIHLQWALAHLFGRNPREDYDWPSREDLELKKQWLEAELGRGGRHQERYESELSEVKRRLDK
jgi:hypothetical protein